MRFSHCIPRGWYILAGSFPLLLLFTHVAQAQSPPTNQPDDFALLTYDVRDLVLNVPDYPYPFGGAGLGISPTLGVPAGGFGGGGFGGGATGGRLQLRNTPGGGAAPVSANNQLTMDTLQNALQAVVAPGTWELQGGKGRVQPLGSSLVVWQTREVHTQVEDLLRQLREGSGERRTVQIDARWLLLDSDDLDRLMPPGQDGISEVDRAILADFTRRPTSIRGITNCFSGQLVYLVSGTRRSVVSSYVPVVGSVDQDYSDERLVSLQGESICFIADSAGGGNVGYQPIVSQLNFGALLEIRPTLTKEGDVAVVDLKSTLTVLGQQPSDIGPPPAVDRVAIETQEIATTLRVPLEQPTLVGGLTYVPPSVISIKDHAQAHVAQASPPTAESRQLYLLLELR